MLTGSAPQCGTGGIHPLLSGIITNLQVLWLPFPPHPPSLISFSWFFICRICGGNTGPAHALVGCGHGCCAPSPECQGCPESWTCHSQGPGPSLDFSHPALRKCTISSSPWYASASPEEVARVAGAGGWGLQKQRD